MYLLRSIVTKVVAPIAIIASSVLLSAFIKPTGTPQRIACEKPVTPTLQVVQPQPFNESVTLRTYGEVVPFRVLTVKSELSGRVTQRHPFLKNGMAVKAGETLLKLDDRSTRQQVTKLNASIERKQIEHASALKERELNQRRLKVLHKQLSLEKANLARKKKLQHKSSILLAEVEEALTQVLLAESAALDSNQQQINLEKTIDSLDCGISELKADLEMARIELEKATIIAPFAGIVVESHIEQGSVVQAGERLCIIRDTTRLEVECSLPSQEAELVLNAQFSSNSVDRQANADSLLRCCVSFKSGEELHRWCARLDRRDGRGYDLETRSMCFRITVDNKDLSAFPLVNGMFVNVEVEIAGQDNLLTLPSSCIGPGNLVRHIAAGKVVEQQISVVERLPNQVILIEPENSWLDRSSKCLLTANQLLLKGTEHHFENIELVQWTPQNGLDENSRGDGLVVENSVQQPLDEINELVNASTLSQMVVIETTGTARK